MATQPDRLDDIPALCEAAGIDSATVAEFTSAVREWRRSAARRSSAARWIDDVVQRFPQLTDLTIEQLVYVVARLAVAIHKEPPPGFDGRWSTMTRAIVQRLSGPHLTMAAGLLGGTKPER